MIRLRFLLTTFVELFVTSIPFILVDSLSVYTASNYTTYIKLSNLRTVSY